MELPDWVICSLAKVLWMWCGEKDSVAVRCNVSVIYGPGVISGERLCHLSDCYGSELWLSLARVSHGQAIVLLNTLLNTVLRHCLVAESRCFVTTSTITSTLTQSVSYFIIFPSWQPISLCHQLKCPSIFTAFFSITNWNVFLPSPPISQCHQLICPSILKPISLWPVSSFPHPYNLFPYDQFHCCPPISIPSFKIVALQKDFPRIFCTPLLSNCKNHRVTVFSILTAQFDPIFYVFR